MYDNKYILIIILILIIALFSGCTEDREQYFSKTVNQTLILYSDNTFTLVRPAKYDLSGTYRIDHGTLVLIFPPFGETYPMKIEYNRLIDFDDGVEWVKI